MNGLISRIEIEQMASESGISSGADGSISDHEYLGGKGRLRPKRRSHSQVQSKRKKHKTSVSLPIPLHGETSSSGSSDMDMADEDEPANYDCNKFPNYKILTLPDYGSLGVRAIQSTSRSEVQPMLVGSIQDDYIPYALPRDIEELEFWVETKQVIEYVLCDLQLIDYTEHNHWVCSKKLSQQNYITLLEKYPHLTDSDIAAIESIKTGFVNPSADPPKSLDNGVGREALTAILLICRDTLRHRFPEERLCRTLKISNIGSNASDYTGNCVIATYDDWEDLPEEKALEFLDQCKLPTSKRSRRGPTNVRVFTPDVQVCSQHVPIRDFCFLSAKLKAECMRQTKSNEEILQCWMQSLIGLKRSDTAYGVVLTPVKGIIFQIHVESREGRKYKRLATKKKVWNFIGDTKTTGNMFQINQFLDFMSAITGIMFQHKEGVLL